MHSGWHNLVLLNTQHDGSGCSSGRFRHPVTRGGARFTQAHGSDCWETFLEILLTSLSRKGITRVVLSVGFMAEKISGYFGDRFGNLELIYVVEREPLGTGGAVRLGMQVCVTDHVFVFNGDTFLDLEMDQVEHHWQLHRRPIIVGREHSDTARYGRLVTAEGAVIGIAEKGATGPGLINAGCYIFNRGQLDGCPAGTRLFA